MDEGVFDLCNAARREGRVKIIACNRAWEMFDADVIHGCNTEFWHLWWGNGLAEHPADKWTTRQELEGVYPGLNYIEERWADGLSTDPAYVHAHHGTGPQAVNLALHYGARRILLVGWTMSYGPKMDPNDLRGTYIGKRRYLGEDTLTENHWPMTGPCGEFVGLIREMETIHPEAYGVEIWNCTPGSAMHCFKMENLDDALAAP